MDDRRRSDALEHQVKPTPGGRHAGRAGFGVADLSGGVQVLTGDKHTGDTVTPDVNKPVSLMTVRWTSRVWVAALSVARVAHTAGACPFPQDVEAMTTYLHIVSSKYPNWCGPRESRVAALRQPTPESNRQPSDAVHSTSAARDDHVKDGRGSDVYVCPHSVFCAPGTWRRVGGKNRGYPDDRIGPHPPQRSFRTAMRRMVGLSPAKP